MDEPKDLIGIEPDEDDLDLFEQAVIVEFKYGYPNLDRLFEVDSQLELAVEKAGVGIHDGHDIAAGLSEGSYFLFGPDADKLYQTIRPILESQDFTKSAKVTLRYGPPDEDAPEKTFVVGSHA